MQEVIGLEVERSQPQGQMQVIFTLWGPASDEMTAKSACITSTMMNMSLQGES